MEWKQGLCDIHCHVIPGVDDGASEIREAMRMLKIEYDEGVRTVIATPHFRVGMFEPSMERVVRQFLLLKKVSRKIFPDLDLYLGCEHHANSQMTEQIAQRRCCTMAGSRYVLVEFSEQDARSYVRERIYFLLSHGFRPVIAHAERCLCIREDLNFLEELVELGAKIQVNADSITREGFGMRHFCRQLMKRNLLHFVGSDGHGNKKRVPHLGQAYEAVVKKMGKKYADQIFIRNPQKLILESAKEQIW